jgi:DNA-binding XRE family transcriptional regulator
MGVSFFTTPNGEEFAVLAREDFEALTAAAEHAHAVNAYRSGRLPGLTPNEARELAASATPLAFWRKKRNLTQAGLATHAGVTQTYISEIENGNRTGTVELWLKLSRVLNLPIESLVDEE